MLLGGVKITQLSQTKVDATESDVGVDDVAKLLLGNVFEGLCTDQGAEDHTAYAVQKTIENGGRQKATAGAKCRHRKIAYKEIGGDGGHVFLLAWLGRDEIEHGGRTLHGKESTHQSAQSAHANLHTAIGVQANAVVKESKIERTDDEQYAQSFVKPKAVNTTQATDGKGRHHDEREQHWAQLYPVDVAPQTDGDEQIRRQRQQSRQRGGFCITGQKHW